ncbi:uncharacterized protein CG7065 isoform X2 [Bradysia coprophila]|nr:uncharacterized protein CG7065 isoform X2 [Bradysia coprophila]
MFNYICHLCGVNNLPGERCLQTHIAGRKHQMKLQSPIDAKAFRAPITRSKPQISMNIAPGEPVPPGFENEVKQQAEIQPALDRIKDEALVGLEYITELVLGEGKEASYHCVLCDKRGDPRTILHHITSYNHRLKYLEKHFPTVIREISAYRYNKDARDIMPRILQGVCEAIEDQYGRLTPFVYEYNSYMRNRMKCLQEIVADRHFDEKLGSTFINIIDRKAIADAITSGNKNFNLSKRKRESSPSVRGLKRSKVGNRADRNSLDSISSASSGSMPKSPRRHRRVVGTIDLRSKSRSGSISPVRRDDGSASNREKKKQMLPTPKELAAQSDHIARERYKWEKYRCMVELAMPELDKALEEHEKNPEKHPLYPTEWKKFWNRRYKELQAEKKDPNKHDFKPEWIIFWTRRLKELHNENVEKKKAEIRKKLNLPADGIERTDELLEQYTLKCKRSPPRNDEPKRPAKQRVRKSPRPRSRSRSRSRTARSRSRSRGVRSRSISPFDHRSRSHGSRRSKSHSRPSVRSSRRSPSRSPPHGYHDTRGYDYYRHGGTREPLDEWGRPIYYGGPRSSSYYYKPPPPTETHQAPVEEVEDEPLTVVSVLRLLTALEEKLGSLGPKVIDLLAKALALEKVKANSADDMLINEDNCVIFETIKEKLKGQLIAGVIEPNKINAVKRAVKNVAAIIHLVSKKSKEQPSEDASKTTVESKPVLEPTASASSPAVDLTDKATIAKNIAAALIMQGKTDITSEQLEELVQVYTQMAQKAKETKESVTTAQFLQESDPLPDDEDTNNSSPAESTSSTSKENIAIPSPENAKEETPPEDADDAVDASSLLESLTDSDLQTLLQNFKDLSTEEQQHLIAYLKKLEASEPARVEKLRKFVNVDVTKPDDEVVTEKTEKVTFCSSRASKPVSSKPPADNIFFDDEDDHLAPPPKRIGDSDEEDDYSFDDVFRAVSKNVKEKPHPTAVNDEQNEESDASSTESTSTQKLSLSIADTQNLIANLMGSFQKNVKNMTSAPSANHTAPVQTEKSVPFYQQQTTYYDETSNGMPSSSAATSLYDTNQGSYNNMPYFQQGYGQMPPNNQPYPVQYPNMNQNQPGFGNPMMQGNPMDGQQQSMWNNNQRMNSMVPHQVQQRNNNKNRQQSGQQQRNNQQRFKKR